MLPDKKRSNLYKILQEIYARYVLTGDKVSELWNKIKFKLGL